MQHRVDDPTYGTRLPRRQRSAEMAVESISARDFDSEAQLKATQSNTRKSHYLPKFFLAGFTATGTKDGKLYGLDVSVGEWFVSSPADCGTQRDFYRVNASESDDPLWVEKWLQGVEGRAAPVSRAICRDNKLPSRETESFDVLVVFTAIMGARTPAVFNSLKTVFNGVGNSLLRKTAASRDRFTEIMRDLATKHPDSDKVTYEDFREFVERGQYHVETSKNHLILMMIRGAQVLTAELIRRNWSLLVWDDEAPNLICPDRPVVFVQEGSGRSRVSRAEDVDLRSSEALFPIDRRHLLMIGYDNRARVIKPPASDVAMINSIMVQGCERFVYCAEKGFSLSQEK